MMEESFYFFGINNSFYNTLYGEYNNPPNRYLISLSEYPTVIQPIKKLNGWRLPLPWLRGKIANTIYMKKCFNEQMKNLRVDKGKKNYFIVYGRILDIYGPAIVEYLKSVDPKSVIICYLGDVASSFRFEIRKIKRKFNAVFSLDRKDALNNDVIFLQEPYSYISLEDEEKLYDVTFIGAAKDRYDKLINVYSSLLNEGYKLNFYITGISEDKQLFKESIHYNTYLDYNDVLKQIAQSRCILEILQGGADTTTTRFSEAVIFKKNLLTNSDYLRSLKSLPPNIFTFKDDIVGETGDIIHNYDYDNAYWVKELSIDNMISTIKGYLSKTKKGDFNDD